MKRIVSICLCLVLVSLFTVSAGADASLLTAPDSINAALQSGKAEKIEVSDNLDEYSVWNEEFTEFDDTPIRLLILQREPAEKEFTAKKVYPPFTDDDGFGNDFSGVDIGKGKLYLRADLMAQINPLFRADSLENATYLIIGEDMYLHGGTLTFTDFKNSTDEQPPEFKDAEEMKRYFEEHPKEVEAKTYYPMFSVNSTVAIYKTETKKIMFFGHNYIPYKYLGRNPEASDQWYYMTLLSDLINELNGENGVDKDKVKETIEQADYIPQAKKDLWLFCIDADEYSTAAYSMTEYYWSMAAEFKTLDPIPEHAENYDVIIRERDMLALAYYVNYCDYNGFDRSAESIKTAKDYLPIPDSEWMETTLGVAVDIYK